MCETFLECVKPGLIIKSCIRPLMRRLAFPHIHWPIESTVSWFAFIVIWSARRLELWKVCTWILVCPRLNAPATKLLGNAWTFHLHYFSVVKISKIQFDLIITHLFISLLVVSQSCVDISWNIFKQSSQDWPWTSLELQYILCTFISLWLQPKHIFCF